MTGLPGSRVDVDGDLVQALRHHDSGAVEQLIERFGGRVYGLARRITGSQEDTGGVVQEALWTHGA